MDPPPVPPPEAPPPGPPPPDAPLLSGPPPEAPLRLGRPDGLFRKCLWFLCCCGLYTSCRPALFPPGPPPPV